MDMMCRKFIKIYKKMKIFLYQITPYLRLMNMMTSTMISSSIAENSPMIITLSVIVSCWADESVVSLAAASDMVISGMEETGPSGLIAVKILN